MKKLLYPLMACLTLGLAPHFPEPHLWGKLRWIFGGGVDMKLIDWGDFIFHALPWFWLLLVIFNITKQNKQAL